MGNVLTWGGQEHRREEQEGPEGHGGAVADTASTPPLCRLATSQRDLDGSCFSCKPPLQVTWFTANTDTNFCRRGGGWVLLRLHTIFHLPPHTLLELSELSWGLAGGQQLP